MKPTQAQLDEKKALAKLDLRKCSRCLNVLPNDDEHFAKLSTGFQGLQGHCKKCAVSSTKAWKSSPRNKKAKSEHNRKANLKRKFGMSVKTYNEMLEAQNGVCAICKTTCVSGRSLAVDHDHSCCSGDVSCGRCVRQLLCAKCNSVLGLVNDDPSLLNAALDYLSKHNPESR